MMNIYQKLVEVRKSVKYLQKEAKGHQYNYVSSSQVLGALRQAMDEQGLLLIPHIKHKEVHIDGKSIFTELEIEYEWVNAENPEERIRIPWYGQGLDISGEKGVGKALTYAEKYLLLKLFNIPTDLDDPDAYQQQVEQFRQPQAKKGPHLATKAQKQTISSMIHHLQIPTSVLNKMREELGITSSDSMTVDQAEQLINALSNYKAEREATA